MNFINRVLLRVAQRLSNERVPFDSKKYIEVVASIEEYILSNKNFQGDFNNSLYKWGTWVAEIFGALSIDCGAAKKYRDPFELE